MGRNRRRRRSMPTRLSALLTASIRRSRPARPCFSASDQMRLYMVSSTSGTAISTVHFDSRKLRGMWRRPSEKAIVPPR